MLIASQNLTNYGFSLPNDTIFRINLAWINSLDELTVLLKKHSNQKIFLDLPIGRTKPPNNKYDFNKLIPIFEKNKNISYFAISNVDSKNDLEKFLKILPKHITIIPKIESPQGVNNIEEIISILPEQKILMLDHDDLFSNTLKQNETPEDFQKYFANIVAFCSENNIVLLRTIGVIFSDTEKRISEYIK